MVIHFRHIFMAVLSLFSLFCHAQKNTPDVNHQDYWIDKYLSVSFPLQRVEINSAFGIRKDPFTGKEKEHCGLALKAHDEYVLDPAITSSCVMVITPSAIVIFLKSG